MAKRGRSGKDPKQHGSEPDANDAGGSFEDLMPGVRRLSSDRVVVNTPPPQPIPVNRMADELNALEESRNALPDPVQEALAAGEALRWCQPGVERDLKRLARGDFSIEGSLDLHGHTIEEAKVALGRFLADAKADGCHCIRVIHGKGHGSPGRIPVLRSKVSRWLMSREDVLAFCSAPSNDGGTGVAYVLLARRR